MAQVIGPTPAARVHDGGFRILSATEVKTMLVRYVDPEGKEAIVEVCIAGEANYNPPNQPEDRFLGIWRSRSMQQLQEELQLLPKAQARLVIAALEERGFVREGKLVAAAQEAAPLPDVSAVFEDAEDKVNG